MNKPTEKFLKGRVKKGSVTVQGLIKDAGLKQQYEIIRKDLLKLREDIEKGYGMAKSQISRKGLLDSVRRKK
jgi:hypothetical protein